MKRLENFFGSLCEKFPFEITFYEEKGMCVIKRKDCWYCKLSEEKNYLCNKKNYSRLSHPTLKLI